MYAHQFAPHPITRCTGIKRKLHPHSGRRSWFRLSTSSVVRRSRLPRRSGGTGGFPPQTWMVSPPPTLSAPADTRPQGVAGTNLVSQRIPSGWRSFRPGHPANRPDELRAAPGSRGPAEPPWEARQKKDGSPHFFLAIASKYSISNYENFRNREQRCRREPAERR